MTTPAPSLTATLSALGMTHQRAKVDTGYRHDVLDSDEVVFTGTAYEVREWLRAGAPVPIARMRHDHPKETSPTQNS